ncbi:hypothetical protein PAXRUDRAFT_700131 [Paxillus rubicundulus Ve08.2h10]|uniref:HIG1 domain-containing protein n=1 Tax=Paxillus rubicundulus Ve08.2h10 TaxID=930991 RepID=A0A0D0DUW4_9AGAM|nr:hypothetical protein PAXRUDRAFT_700131 [Paxillus rubicundulus Ve08.2h10]
MKIGLSDEEIREHRAVTIQGAVEGALIGTGIAFPAFYLLNKRFRYYHSLPLPLKVLGGVIVITPLISIRGEQRGLEYDRQHWTGVGKTELERSEQAERERWASMGLKDKVAYWAARHQLSVIMGSWATTMTIAGHIILRDPMLTMSQKVVQARLWAQGLTIGVLIATAALTHAQRVDAVETRRHGGDHSWLHVRD